MRIVKRKQRRKQSREWGVVETRSDRGCGHGRPVWLAHWMDLAEDGNLSVEIEPDRAATITPATWGRARRALGLPERILVLDDETAERVRRAVPPKVAVAVAADDPRLKNMAAMCAAERDDDDAIDNGDDDLDDSDLDLVPFPTPRARC
jgi:hypothetical protein